MASRAVSVPDLVGKNKLTAAGQLVLSGQITETLSTGTRLDDWAPAGIDAASGILLDVSVATTITGIASGTAPRVLYLVNRQSSPAAVTITARDPNSTDGNRFGMDVDLVLANGDGALFVWSPALSGGGGFWRCVGTYTPTAFDASGAAASALSAAEAYADSGDASTLATAESYADAGDALALQKGANLSDVADQQTALDNLLPASPSKGDVAVYDGTHWVKHAHGSDGQLMQFDSTASDGISNITSPAVPYKTLAAEILADTPMAFWKLDETSGTTFADSSGNGYDLTLSGGAGITLARAPIIPALPATYFPFFTSGGEVASRSGTLGFSTPITGAWTVEFIIQFGYAGIATVPFAIVNNGETSADNIQIQIDMSITGQISSEIEYGSGTNIKRNFNYICGNHTGSLHIVVTKDGSLGDLRCYVNGCQRGATVSVATDPTGGGSANTYIGNYVAGASEPNDSIIAYMAVYDTALSASRIAVHARAAGLHP